MNCSPLIFHTGDNATKKISANLDAPVGVWDVRTFIPNLQKTVSCSAGKKANGCAIRRELLYLKRTLDEHSTRHLDDKKKESDTSDTKDKVLAMRRAPGSQGDPSDGKVTTFHASMRIPAVTQDLWNYFLTVSWNMTKSEIRMEILHRSCSDRMSYKNSEEGTQVEASNVAQPASKSLKQHSYPAEEIILVARMIFYSIFTLDKRGSIIFDPQRKKRIDVPFGKDSHVRNGASTSGQLAEQKQIKKWMALKTTDTKGKTPAMGRARSSEDLPLSWMPFITLYITLHSDEPP
ncbi:hypothetical protein T02_3970 [Trichinella nativa]|uniref:Uncharacterized protein n=1 Tax=Trichinella nativa TaxID=6335 RepID=A0A0V1LJT2_9BILA|nr:hypothetical protein T02_3970 [Trichinella nativa]